MSETTVEYSDSEKIREIWALFKETDKKFQETDRQFKETDKKFQETDRQFKQTAKEVEAVCKRVDALTGKWGRFVEGLIVPGLISMFRERGIEIHTVFQRAKADRNGDRTEIDVLGINDEYAVLVEVKSTLSVDDVKEHLERIGKFRHFFPVYADRKLVGAVAGIVIEGEADKFAYRKGLFVIAQTGESVAIINDDKFKPKVW